MTANEQLQQLQQELKLVWNGRKKFLLALFLVLASLGFGYYVTYAEYDKISTNQDDLTTATDDLDLARQRQTAWNRALQDPMFATMSATLDNVLFSRKPMLEIIYAISGSTAEDNVQLTKFEFSPGDISTSSGQIRATTTQPSLTLDLTLSAPFAQLLDYLIKIEHLQPIGSINNLQLGKSQGGPSSARLTYRTFYDESRTTTTTSSTNLPQLTPVDRQNLEDISRYRIIKDSDLEQAELILGDKLTLLD